MIQWQVDVVNGQVSRCCWLVVQRAHPNSNSWLRVAGWGFRFEYFLSRASLPLSNKDHFVVFMSGLQCQCDVVGRTAEPVWSKQFSRRLDGWSFTVSPLVGVRSKNWGLNIPTSKISSLYHSPLPFSPFLLCSAMLLPKSKMLKLHCITLLLTLRLSDKCTAVRRPESVYWSQPPDKRWLSPTS